MRFDQLMLPGFLATLLAAAGRLLLQLTSPGEWDIDKLPWYGLAATVGWALWYFPAKAHEQRVLAERDREFQRRMRQRPSPPPPVSPVVELRAAQVRLARQGASEQLLIAQRQLAELGRQLAEAREEQLPTESPSPPRPQLSGFRALEWKDPA